jgi:hypothetical protein
VLALADYAHDLATDVLERHFEGAEHPRGHPVAFPKQSQQQMLRAYVIVLEIAGFFLGQHHDLSRTLREPFEHGRILS